MADFTFAALFTSGHSHLSSPNQFVLRLHSLRQSSHTIFNLFTERLSMSFLELFDQLIIGKRRSREVNGSHGRSNFGVVMSLTAHGHMDVPTTMERNVLLVYKKVAWRQPNYFNCGL